MKTNLRYAILLLLLFLSIFKPTGTKPQAGKLGYLGYVGCLDLIIFRIHNTNRLQQVPAEAIWRL